MIKALRKLKLTRLQIILIALIAIVAVFELSALIKSKQNVQVASANEIESIKATKVLDDQIRFYKQLIQRVGPEQAQVDLYRSGLPFDGQTHLLNHTVGDYIYQKYGPSGLPLCEEYFLASCYHGFILNAIASGGDQELDKIAQICQKGGPTVSGQCSHAFGHGFLAAIDYTDLPQALRMCDDAVSRNSTLPAFNCYDGVFMENIWALHEGAPSKNRWVKETDHVYPCNDPRIAAKYLQGCWSNQPSLAYQQLNGQIKPVSDICLNVKDSANKQMCFNGLARQIHPLTNGSVDATFSMCGQVAKAWVDYCANTVATAAFSVGDRLEPYAICKRQQGSPKSDCYQLVFGIMRAYSKSSSDIQSWCSAVEEEPYKSQCLQL